MVTFHETREILVVIVAILIISIAMAFFITTTSHQEVPPAGTSFPVPQSSVGVEKIPSSAHDIFAS